MAVPASHRATRARRYQADAPAFLRQIHEHARALALDHVECHVQLIAAIAAERLE